MISFDERFEKAMDELTEAGKADSWEYECLNVLSCYDVIRRLVMTYYPYDSHERWEQTIQTVAHILLEWRKRTELEGIADRIEDAFRDYSVLEYGDHTLNDRTALTRIHDDIRQLQEQLTINSLSVENALRELG